MTSKSNIKLKTNMITTSQFNKIRPALISSYLVRSLVRLLPQNRVVYARATNSRYVKFFLPRRNTIMVAPLDSGISITVDVNDYNGRMLYLCGIAYPEVVNTCYNLLHPGDNFFDIGANYGTVGLLCRDAVGESGTVHLFEPQPNLCQRLHSTIENYNLVNVCLHEIGLLDRDDVIELSVSKNHSGEASFVFNQNESTEQIKLHVKNIATYLPPLIGNKRFGAKVDVEGAEPYLLPWLIQHPQLSFLVFENTHLSAQERDKVFKLTTEKGFVLFGIGKETRTCLHLATDSKHFSDFHDVVAVRVKPSVSLPSNIKPEQLRQFQITDTNVF